MADTQQVEGGDEQENPRTRDALLALLRGKGIDFTHETHAAVRTSEEAAQVRGSKLESGAKALIVDVKPKASSALKPFPPETEAETLRGKTFALLVMPATRKLHSNRAKNLLAAKSFKFASVEDVSEIAGVKPGAVPPFGSIMGLRTFLDEAMDEVGETIDFNCGLRTESVRMKLADFLAVEEPVRGDFTS